LRPGVTVFRGFELIVKLLVVFTVFILSTWSVAGQVVVRTSGILTGTVYDQQGAICPGIRVTLKGQNKKQLVTETDGKGEYRIEAPVGFYSIRFDTSTGNWLPIKFKKYFLASAFSGSMKLDIALQGKAIEDTFGVGRGR
jgi:hypothetical protein